MTDIAGYLLSVGVGWPRLVLIPLAAQTTRSGSRWSVSNEGEISCRNSSRRFERTCKVEYTPVSCCYFYKTPTYVMDREITFAALFYSMCNTVESKFAQQLSDAPCLLFDVFTMLLRGKCLQKSTCLQSEDLDDRLEDPGKAGKSGLSDTSASN